MSRARHALRLACRPPLPLHNCHKPCQAIRTAPVAGQDDRRAIGYACRRQASEDGSALLALPSRRIKAPANLSFRWKEWSSDSGTRRPVLWLIPFEIRPDLGSLGAASLAAERGGCRTAEHCSGIEQRLITIQWLHLYRVTPG